MKKTLVEEFVADPKHMRLYQQERAIYEVTELLESRMAELGVSRAELARRLGKTRGWVTQLLDGEANKTIRTVADAFAVLGQEYRSFSQPIQISNTASRVAVETRPIRSGDSRQVVSDEGVICLYTPDAEPKTLSLQLEEVAL